MKMSRALIRAAALACCATLGHATMPAWAAPRGEEHRSAEDTAAEIALLRGLWQRGAAREALAYAHLVAGEHPESMEALAWLVRIEDRMGQHDAAMKRLAEATAARPGDRTLADAHAALQGDAPASAAVGLLFDRGDRVLLPWAARSGLPSWFSVVSFDGHMRRGVVEGVDAQVGLLVLRLLGSLPTSGNAPHHARLVAGRPAMLLASVEEPSSVDAPFRPRLVPGLVTRGGVASPDRARFSASHDAAGAALVFDLGGRLIGWRADDGLVTTTQAARDTLHLPASDDTAAAARLSAEELYERLLPHLVQVHPAP